MKLSMFGDESSSTSTFRNIVLATIVVSILRTSLAPPAPELVDSDDDEMPFDVIPPSPEDYPPFKSFVSSVIKPS